MPGLWDDGLSFCEDSQDCFYVLSNPAVLSTLNSDLLDDKADSVDVCSESLMLAQRKARLWTKLLPASLDPPAMEVFLKRRCDDFHGLDDEGGTTSLLLRCPSTKIPGVCKQLSFWNPSQFVC